MATTINVYDLEDDRIIDLAYEAGILADLEDKWLTNHGDTIEETFREFGFGNYGAAGRKVDEKCRAWVAKEARERFADGLELPGYGEAA